MKKVILSLLTALLFCGTATAQRFSVADVEALPGETVSFEITVDVAGGTYSGFQFQMQFPSEGFATTGTTVSAAWDGGSLSVGDLVGGAANGSAFSSSDTAIPDGEQVIGSVRFTVGEGVAVGSYDVTISGFDFLDGTNYTHTEDVTFKVNVVSAHTVVLDENSTVAPEAAEGVNVRVKRTIKANQWSTIVLPFEMTEEQTKVAFGADVQIADFIDYDTTDDGDGNTIGIHVNFSSVTAMEANHPYIIKVTTAVTEFSAEDVTIDPEESPVVEYDNGLTGKKRKVFGTFAGTYVADFDFYNDAAYYPLFLSGNKFYYATESTQHMKAFRGYFDFVDNLPEAEEAASRIVLTFGETNSIRGISNAQSVMGNDGYYSLDGRKFSAKPTMRGVYIKNGKKLIVR